MGKPELKSDLGAPTLSVESVMGRVSIVFDFDEQSDCDSFYDWIVSQANSDMRPRSH